jgi:hypothetical protein
LLISDRRVVDSLLRSGSDPKKPHSLEFVFQGSADSLEQMQVTLSGRGYTLIRLKPAEELIMAKSMTLDLGPIYEESMFLEAECKKLGIKYDGWGCLVVK